MTLELLAVAVFESLVPTARAGVLDNFLLGENEILVSNINSSYVAGYNSFGVNSMSKNPTTVNDNFLVAIYSPSQNDIQPKPEAIVKSIIDEELTISITGYSSTTDQTDDDPFTTAMGTHVRDGIVAANFLPFGTKIKIPQIFGDKIFTVEDRMNKRYWERIDIWFPDRESADNFGLRTLKIQVLES